MTPYYVLCAVLGVVIVCLVVSNRNAQKDAANERLRLVSIYEERVSELLDRIQAPTFGEYTNKVIREKKAEQPQEEEKPIEFVS